MAESQVPYTYTAAMESSLQRSISAPRMSRYLRQTGHDFTRAMDLYLWNSRLSKSLQFPLQVAEVTLRNAVHEHLQMLGMPSEWAFDVPSMQKLNAKNAEIVRSINKSIERLLQSKMKPAQYDLNVRNANHQFIPSFEIIGTDDVIAKLPFETWMHMFDYQFENDWNITLRRVFPNIAPTTFRKGLFNQIGQIKTLRNRIAHHEPIFDLANLPTLVGEINNLISIRCKDTEAWTKTHTTFMSIWHQRPSTTRQATGRPIIEVANKVDVVDDISDTMGSLISKMRGKKHDMVMVRHDDELKLVSGEDIGDWLRTWVANEVVDLTVTIRDFMDKAEPRGPIAFVSKSATTGDARSRFFDASVPPKQRPRAIVITSDGSSSGDVLGLITKPDFN